MKRRPIKLTAKCVSCKHEWVMNDKQIKHSQAEGVARCPKCWDIATVKEAK